MDVVDRIPLHRHVAVVREDTIAVRPAPSQLLGPLAELVAAGLAVLAIVLWLDTLPVWALMALLLFAVLAGPIGVLGLVFGAIGSTFLLERPKGSARWQQGFLGLGIGTTELVPFHRIDRIEVRGDYDAELRSGERNDLVHWEVLLIKDNGKELIVGTAVVPRPLAAEGAERANRLAVAVAEQSGQRAVLADLEALAAWEEAERAAEAEAWDDDWDEVDGWAGEPVRPE